MNNNNVPEEVIKAKADELMRELDLPVDHNADIWLALKLGITAGIGLGIDKSQEVFDRVVESRRAGLGELNQCHYQW